MRQTLPLRPLVVLAAVLVALSWALPATQAAPSFAGEAITIIVPKSPGGGTDILARTVARHLRNFIPGKPTVVIRNMGASRGLIGTNFGWNARPDGKTILSVSATEVIYNIFRQPGAEYRLHEMYPIFSSPTGNVYFAKRGLFKEPKEVMTAKGIIFGSGEPNDVFVWAKELLGFTPEKMIWGYSGAESRQAFLQGEINVGRESTIGYNSVMASYVKKGEAMPLFQSGILDSQGNVVREPAAPDAPTVAELYEQVYGKKPSGPVFESYKLLVGIATYGKGFLLPKGVPEDIASVYEAAVAEMIKDPKFLKEMESMNPRAPHLFGKDLVRNYPKVALGDPEVAKFMRKILLEKYKMSFD